MTVTCLTLPMERARFVSLLRFFGYRQAFSYVNDVETFSMMDKVSNQVSSSSIDEDHGGTST